MSRSFDVWLVIVIALGAANWPFLTERRWFFGALCKEAKPLALRLLELLLLYFVVGVLALLLEKRTGQIAQQSWEFYAVTAALFVTFAFPGFVWCYLARRGAAGKRARE